MKKVIVIVAALLLVCCNSLKAESDTAKANSLIAYIYKSASYCRTENINDSIDLLAKIDPSYAKSNKYILSKASLFFCIKKIDEGYKLIDSLIDIPYGNLDLETRSLAFYQKGRQLRKERKTKESLAALDSSKTIANRIGFNKYAGLALYQMGRIYEDENNYVSALKSYYESVEFLIKTNTSFLGELYKSLGIVYRKMGLYEEAIKSYTDALDFYLIKEYNYGIASVYNSMGILSTTVDHYKRAQSYFNKALFYDSNIEDNRSVELNAFNNLGVLFNQTNRYDSAIIVLNKAFEMAKIQQNLGEASKAINNLAIAYKGKENYEKSLAYYHRALKLKRISGSKSGFEFNYLGMANVFGRTNRFDSAQHYFKLTSRELSRESVTKIRSTYYEYYANFLERKGDFNGALNYTDSANQIQTQLVQKEYAELAASYEVLFNSKEEEHEKQKLENELIREKSFRDIEEAKTSKYRAWLITAIGLIIIILWFAIVTARNKQTIDKANEKLKETNEKLEQSIEENKNLIGIVAHDLKTPFAQISGLLDLVEIDDNEQKSYLATAAKVCHDGSILVNDLVLAHKSETIQVNKAQLVLNDVFKTLKEKHQGKLKKKDISLNIMSNGISELNTDKDLLFRILDNYISNAIKFSKPNTSIAIGAKEQEKGELLIFVKDQGPGIPDNEKPKLFKKYASLSNKPTNGESSSGLGLYITKVLGEKLDAEVGANSEQGKGSEFYIKFN